MQSSVPPTLLDITSLLLWIIGHLCSVVLAILACLKAWNGTRFFFANKWAIPRPRSMHWRTVFLGAARRQHGDGLGASWPFNCAIILQQGCRSYWRVAAVHVLFSMMRRNQALWVLFCLLLFSFTLTLFPSFASSGLAQAAGCLSITSFQMALY